MLGDAKREDSKKQSPNTAKQNTGALKFIQMHNIVNNPLYVGTKKK